MAAPGTGAAVRVVIPVKDGARVLGACLDALAAQEAAPPYEVVVVDNGSRDGSAALARAHAVVTRVLSEPRPGSYAARNAGVRDLDAEVVAFTDADCVPAPNWLARGVAFETPVVAGRIAPLASPRPSVWERYDTATYLAQDDLVATHGFGATANLFVRAEVLEATGGFDASLRSSGDRDFGRRAREQGYATRYAADVVVAHRPRTTAAETWRLHRRLGAGFRATAAPGTSWRDEPNLNVGWDWVAARAGSRDPALRAAHELAMAARRTGWLTRSG